MDKYEYQVCADQIKALCSEGRYAEAMDIADDIDWRRVKSFSMLCTVSEIYKVNKHYDESREILLLAYERYPDRASVIYALCELDIKLGDIKEAKEFYKEYVALKPNDTNKYVLLYRLYEAMDYTLEDKISLLEEFKRFEYTEKWAYELALLYHKVGQESKCVETCDELVLWFGEGTYVRKALELKMQHAPLTEEQQRKYDGVDSAASYMTQSIPQEPDNQIADAFMQQQFYSNQNENMQQTYPDQNAYSQQAYDSQDMYASNAYANSYNQQNYQQQPNGYQNYTQDSYSNAGYAPGYEQNYSQGYDNAYQGIQVQPVGTGKYSTINLQEELARNMQELYERGNVQLDANYYGETAPLYELSQQEYMQRLEQAGAIEEEPEAAIPVVAQNSIEMPVVADLPQEPIEVRAEEPAKPVIAQKEEPVEQAVVQTEESVEQAIVQMEETAEPIKTESAIYAGQLDGQKNLESVLAQEYDGQISLSLQEPNTEPKQITGQIDISDFLKEWELKKQSARQHSLQETKKRQMEQTNDIMSQLVGVIPGLEIKKDEAEEKTEVDVPLEEVVKQDEQGTVTKTTIKAPSYDFRPAKPSVSRTEAGSIVKGPMKSGITGVIPDVLPSSGDREDTEEEAFEDNVNGSSFVVEDVPTEEIPAQEMPLVNMPTVSAPAQEKLLENVPEETTEETFAEEMPVEELFAEKTPVEETFAVEEIPEQEPFAVETPIEEEPPVEEIPAEELFAAEAPVEEVPAEDVSAEDVATAKEAITATNEEPIKYPFQLSDYGEAEEIEDIEQPDEVDDMLKTGAMPLFDIEQAQYEAGIEVNDQDEKRPSVPSYMVLDEKRAARREFDDIEMRIFGRFEGIESLKAQIVDVMDEMSMDPAVGNVIVTGSEIYGRKSLAIGIVKAIQAVDANFSGKVAKISGEALNKKDIPMTLHKLRNGALIVESAGGLTPVTVNLITDALTQGAEPIFVVFEDEANEMEPLISGCKELKNVFSARIEIEDFSNDDLVSYAKGYARELEYSIDEMGELELHTRISELQASIDGVVTIDDVIDIMDNAIHHVDRKNMSHFMDVLLGKRYDVNDYIILREKDFQL